MLIKSFVGLTKHHAQSIRFHFFLLLFLNNEQIELDNVFNDNDRNRLLFSYIFIWRLPILLTTGICLNICFRFQCLDFTWIVWKSRSGVSLSKWLTIFHAFKYNFISIDRSLSTFTTSIILVKSLSRNDHAQLSFCCNSKLPNWLKILKQRFIITGASTGWQSISIFISNK